MDNNLLSEPTSTPSATPIDLSIFQNQSSCKHNEDPRLCEIVKSLLTGLKYYASLDVENNQTHANIFENFVHDLYSPQQLIMDYFHMKSKHGHQIHDIMQYVLSEKEFPPCDIDVCEYSSRLYRVSTDNRPKTQISHSSSLNVMKDIFDSIHHYIFHLFDCGLRNNITDLEEINEDIKTSDDEYFDSRFYSLKKRIKSTRKRTSRFDRISAGNKFNIDTFQEEQNDFEVTGRQGLTYLDCIVIQLENLKIDKEIIDKLIYYLLAEEFCTESVSLDTKIKRGNIASYLDDKQCTDCITDIFDESERTVGAVVT